MMNAQGAREPSAARVLEVQGRIAAALQARGVDRALCPMCRTNGWSLGYYVSLAATPDPRRRDSAAPSGDEYPCVTLICQTCGSMQLLNLLMLGFGPGDLASLSYDEEPSGAS